MQQWVEWVLRVEATHLVLNVKRWEEDLRGEGVHVHFVICDFGRSGLSSSGRNALDGLNGEGDDERRDGLEMVGGGGEEIYSLSVGGWWWKR